MLIEAAVGLSVLLNILAIELTGLSAGGVIVPGYLALYLDQPLRLAATFGGAALTLLLVNLLGRAVVLYGRRRFAAMLLVGFMVNAGIAWLLGLLQALDAGGLAMPDLRAVGYLVPGLIANEMSKQGVVITIAMTMLITVLIRLLLNLLFGTQAGRFA